jgi:hypothetical protein
MDVRNYGPPHIRCSGVPEVGDNRDTSFGLSGRVILCRQERPFLQRGLPSVRRPGVMSDNAPNSVLVHRTAGLA